MIKVKMLDNRKLHVKNEGVLIEQDNNAETLEITVPKYIEGKDLSILDLDFILRMSLGGVIQEIIIKDIKVEIDEIILTVKLRDSHLYKSGNLKISLMIYNNNIRFNTEIATLIVKKTINLEGVTSVEVMETYLDEMRRLLDLLDVDRLKQEVIDSISAEDLEIIEQFNDFMAFPSVGRDGVIYIDLTLGEQYVWDNDHYNRIGSDWRKVTIINGGIN